MQTIFDRQGNVSTHAIMAIRMVRVRVIRSAGTPALTD